MGLRGVVGAGSPSGSEPGLIGVDDLKTPSWAQVDETILGAGMGRMVRAAPVALGLLVRLAWRTSPRLTVLAAALELLTGCATAFGLLATANLFIQLLEQGPTPQRAELRAFTAQRTLLGEHQRIAAQLCAESIQVEHRKTAIRLVGRSLAGVGTALTYGVLGLLLYTGASRFRKCPSPTPARTCPLLRRSASRSGAGRSLRWWGRTVPVNPPWPS